MAGILSGGVVVVKLCIKETVPPRLSFFSICRPFPDLSTHVLIEAPSTGKTPLPFGSEASSHCAKFVAPFPPGKFVNKSYSGLRPPSCLYKGKCWNLTRFVLRPTVFFLFRRLIPFPIQSILLDIYYRILIRHPSRYRFIFRIPALYCSEV